MPREGAGTRIAWYLAAAASAVAVYFGWWLAWQVLVRVMPGAFLELPNSQTDAFTLFGGLLLWIALAVLMALAFELVAKRWTVPARTWLAVATVGVVFAVMWLFTVADVQRGVAAAVDFARLGLVPLIAMATAAYIGIRRGSTARLERWGLSNKGIEQNARR